jgi:hypothetical protein
VMIVKILLGGKKWLELEITKLGAGVVGIG